MSNFAQNMYYEPSNPARSPGSHRQPHQTINRQGSRQLDNYPQIGSGLYDEFPPRFDPPRFDRTNGFSNGYGFDMATAPGAQTWNPGGFGGQQNMIGGTGRMKPLQRPRPNIPNVWLDNNTNPLPPPIGFGNIGGHPLGPPLGGLPQQKQEQHHSDVDEELIPTAIVIKNIPFAVKKEQLVQLMTEMNLPLPYAFNYHFDNGIFRGLAFANFTTADETAMVIDRLNSFELQGRKLRVEYKKMLPLAERERIEQEKRAKRGQLEEQHRQPPGKLQNQASMTSLGSTVPPSPTVPQNRSKPGSFPKRRSDVGSRADIDLNDPQTLQFYSQLLLFRDDMSRERLLFPSNLSPSQRRIVHTLAHHMGLAHISQGNGEQRQVHVYRPNASPNAVSPSFHQIPTGLPLESQRRVIHRNPLDPGDARGSDPGVYAPLGRHSSVLLDVPGSPNLDPMSRQNLRGAKSTADLRSYTPSPVPSSASFPATLGPQGLGRFTDYGIVSGSSNTPTLTPTASGGMLRDDAMLVGGLGSMSLGKPLGNGLSSNREQRSSLALDREQQRTIGTALGAGLGRNAFGMSTGFDDQSRAVAMPVRQPIGPNSSGPGFIRKPPSNASNRQSSTDLDHPNSAVEMVGV